MHRGTSLSHEHCVFLLSRHKYVRIGGNGLLPLCLRLQSRSHLQNVKEKGDKISKQRLEGKRGRLSWVIGMLHFVLLCYSLLLIHA